MTTERTFVPLNIALLTVSDTRTRATDTSGDLLHSLVEEAGHRVMKRAIETDNIYALRARVSGWIADPQVQVIISTGGTGITGRDCTPEAITPLLDKIIDGFGEMFRVLSYDDIGTSTLQSRAFAGLANSTLIFCLPGSNGACRDGWSKLIALQLDSRTTPCNMVELLPRLAEK